MVSKQGVAKFFFREGKEVKAMIFGVEKGEVVPQIYHAVLARNGVNSAEERFLKLPKELQEKNRFVKFNHIDNSINYITDLGIEYEGDLPQIKKNEKTIDHTLYLEVKDENILLGGERILTFNSAADLFNKFSYSDGNFYLPKFTNTSPTIKEDLKTLMESREKEVLKCVIGNYDLTGVVSNSPEVTNKPKASVPTPPKATVANVPTPPKAVASVPAPPKGNIPVPPTPPKAVSATIPAPPKVKSEPVQKKSSQDEPKKRKGESKQEFRKRFEQWQNEMAM